MLNYMRENGGITNEGVQNILGVKQTRAYAIIREMAEAGLIAKRGSDKEDKAYILAE
jgi:predicted HTH transcriptional regulator